MIGSNKRIQIYWFKYAFRVVKVKFDAEIYKVICYFTLGAVESYDRQPLLVAKVTPRPLL